MGLNREDFTLANLVVASGIVDGGFLSFPPTLGDVFTFRRNGPSPFSGGSHLFLNELKIYETANLLSEERGKI